MTGINSTSGVTGTIGATTSTTSTTPTTGSTSLGKDAFLKLLVAQLKYQDPNKPADATQFLSETAQFTMVEKFDDLAAVNAQLLATSRSQSAIALVGRSVTWTAMDGSSQTGVVSGVDVRGGSPVLEIGDQTVSLDAVTRVAPTTA